MIFRPQPGKRLEIHCLRSHAACNLNRDDSGRPKTLMLGGRRRLRTSSQAEKYSIKKSAVFDDFRHHIAEAYGASAMTRTRYISEQVEKKINDAIALCGDDPTQYKEKIQELLKALPALFSKKAQNNHDDKMDVSVPAIPYSDHEIDLIVDAMISVSEKGKIKINKMDKVDALLSQEIHKGDLSPELQLFGRFVASSSFLESIECPLQVAHSFSVNEALIERDYWTATDDLSQKFNKKGSAHIDVRYFGAGVFYQYHCLDIRLLSRNISHAFMGTDRDMLVCIVSDLISAYLYSVFASNPVGHQTTFANNDLPEAIYLSYGSTFPHSAASAFEQPVVASSHGGYMENAKIRLKSWIKDRYQRFGIFCGDDICMGLKTDNDTDLESLVEWGVRQSAPTARIAVEGQ